MRRPEALSSLIAMSCVGVMHLLSMAPRRRYTTAGSAPLRHELHAFPDNGRDMGAFARILNGPAAAVPESKAISIPSH